MKVQTNEIYKLGDHVLGCGSSTDREFVTKVVNATANTDGIKCILTDPPYGVAYVEGKRDFAKLGADSNKGGVRVIANDHAQSEEEYKVFTVAWMDMIKPYLSKYNAFYIFGADSMIRALRNALDEGGYYYSQLLVWVKNTVVIGRKDYLPMHEVITYGWFGKHKMERSKAKSVLFHPKPARSKLHPTMKPPGLLRKILPNSTKTGDWVYDPFGGSGSTLIACEHMGRKCVMIELDTRYVETIIERWETLTGQKATKIYASM